MNEVTNEQVIDRLITSEAGKKAAAEILRDRTTERMNMKAQAEKLRRERGQRKRELADATQAAHSRMTAARKALTSAETEHQQAAMEQAQAQSHFDVRIRKLEGELLATAPAAINEFIEWLGDQESECKGTGIIENARVTSKINTHTSEAVREYFSNAESLRERLEAIRKARHEAEALKDKVLDSDDISQRLEELGNLPVVEMRFSHER